MTDIVERLREARSDYHNELMREAADEIERLEEELKAARTVPDRPIGPTAADEIELLRAGHARLCDKLGERCDEIERLRAARP